MPIGKYVVADTAFPRGARDVSFRIKAPLKHGTPLPADDAQRAALIRFNHQVTTYRQTAEWGMRALQGSFGRLRVPLSAEDVQGRGDLLEVCCRLHNVRALSVGINEIRTVYCPTWQQGEADLWFDFGRTLLSTVRFADLFHRDRVARFHGLDVAVDDVE